MAFSSLQTVGYCVCTGRGGWQTVAFVPLASRTSVVGECRGHTWARRMEEVDWYYHLSLCQLLGSRIKVIDDTESSLFRATGTLLLELQSLTDSTSPIQRKRAGVREGLLGEDQGSKFIFVSARWHIHTVMLLTHNRLYVSFLNFTLS